MSTVELALNLLSLLAVLLLAILVVTVAFALLP
jgi:hypothetical protein